MEPNGDLHPATSHRSARGATPGWTQPTLREPCCCRHSSRPSPLQLTPPPSCKHTCTTNHSSPTATGAYQLDGSGGVQAGSRFCRASSGHSQAPQPMVFTAWVCGASSTRPEPGVHCVAPHGYPETACDGPCCWRRVCLNTRHSQVEPACLLCLP
jgi:hypothetical protein